MKKATISQLFLIFLCAQLPLQSNAQRPTKRTRDWWQADWKKDSIPGISLDEAYKYLKGRKSKTVIVAIIDNCVDTAHEELKDFIWTNKREIPGNGIDDDGNGYVDDVHGWCFIANKENKVQTEESAEEVLVYENWKKYFKDIDTSKLNDIDKAQFDIYKQSKQMLFEKYQYFKLTDIIQRDSIKFQKFIDRLLPEFKESKLRDIPFSTLKFPGSYDSCANLFFAIHIKYIPSNVTLGLFAERLRTIPFFFNGFINFVKGIIPKDKYDTTVNYRAIIGDDSNDFRNKGYGSPAINLPEIGGDHGTFIAGIICADRINGKGIKGISDHVQIMPLVTAVPGGGPMSKDIIMAIRYAIDNGANIINLSFGSVPWLDEHEKEIREVFDYASDHDVLIVNGAGNSGTDLDKEKYLLGQGQNGKANDNFIRVAANTASLNDSLMSAFSEFGANTVDLFAPGSDIYSTIPGNKYESNSGTSFACPMVVGVAALLKSYFPILTAKQIKKIIMKSVFKPDVMVIPPAGSGIKNKVPFSKMSKSGGVVNALNAVKMADGLINNK